MINVLLTTLKEVIEAEQDHSTGNADERDVFEAKKRFSQALNELIDYRIQIAFDERRRSQSYERIAVADSINVGVKSMASTVKSITALNSAPPPPPKDLKDPEKLRLWRESYEDWYETKRKTGITIE